MRSHRSAGLGAGGFGRSGRSQCPAAAFGHRLRLETRLNTAELSGDLWSAQFIQFV